MPVALKAIITVTAGVIPGHIMGEFTKSWNYTSLDYEKDRATPQDQPTIFKRHLDEAHEHAKGLSNPAHLNWVRVDWLWV